MFDIIWIKTGLVEVSAISKSKARISTRIVMIFDLGNYFSRLTPYEKIISLIFLLIRINLSFFIIEILWRK